MDTNSILSQLNGYIEKGKFAMALISHYIRRYPRTFFSSHKNGHVPMQMKCYVNKCDKQWKIAVHMVRASVCEGIGIPSAKIKRFQTIYWVYTYVHSNFSATHFFPYHMYGPSHSIHWHFSALNFNYFPPTNYTMIYIYRECTVYWHSFLLSLSITK